jgi:BirA family biotin operon repressor/biotin-[acetyl-CoA-carboxylase] ligase
VPAPPAHLQWGADALWRALQPLLPGVTVEVLSRTESTNTLLLERARIAGGRRAADAQPCLLVAEQQTRGRGRLGRDWLSSAGASLTFSLALPLAPRDWSGLSLAVGVALAEALDPSAAESPPRIALKWPNDLWLLDAPGRGRKLGGILIETLVLGERRIAVVGVGLNVLPQALPAQALAHGYACLQELDAEASAPQALARVAVPLVRALQGFEATGFAPFAAAFRRRDLLLGHAVTTTAPGAPSGVADGVDEHGALRVRAGERVQRIVAGEVSVRLDPARPGAAAC